MRVAEIILESAKDIGIENLRDEQYQTILEYYRGNDIMFIAPTGFGKSAVYQLCPLLYNKLHPERVHRVIVVEPTISLITDNMLKLKTLCPDLSAVHLTPATLCKAKAASYIFTSPEMLLSDDCRRALLGDKEFTNTITTLFVDECHIIETWGSSDQHTAFREQYAKLGDVRAFISCPVVAMTATANDSTMHLVKQSLKMAQCKDIRIDIMKENISYHIRYFKDDEPSNFDFLIEILKRNKENTDKTLVYFTSIDRLTNCYMYVCDEIGQEVGEEHPLVVMYTKLTNERIKQDILDDLNKPDGLIRVVFCTSSISVGVNLPGIKYVLHYGVPVLAQDFLQETGRASRELSIHAHSILLCFPRMYVAGTSNTMKDFVHGTTCRRKIILNLFNVSCKPSWYCCDICNPALSCEMLEYIQRYINCAHSIHGSSDSDTSSAPSLSNLHLY